MHLECVACRSEFHGADSVTKRTISNDAGAQSPQGCQAVLATSDANTLGLAVRLQNTLGSVMKNGIGLLAAKPSRILPRVALSLWALACVMPAVAQNVSDNFDRGRGERTISYTADGSRDMSRPVVTFNANFVGGDSSSVVTLAFVSAGDGVSVPGARFAACHDIAWNVDGQPLATSPASHRASVMDGDLIEMLEQEVTAQWVEAISTARDVRYKACRNEYALTAGDIAAFGMVAAKLKSATHSSYRPGAGAPGKTTTTEVGYEGMNWRPSSKASPFR